MHDLLVFVPLIFLVAGALISKKMAECTIGATLLALLILHKEHFLSGLIDGMYETISNSSLQFVIIMLTCFGAMVKLFQESGAMIGFGRFVSKRAGGPKMPLILSLLMAALMFIDDYLSTLTVCFSMRGVTDENRIPREHLAFQTNAVASSLCVLAPISSWAAFSCGLISDYGYGFSDYCRAVPLMIYPLALILMCLLLALGAFPKFGRLKESYERVQAGGPTFVPEEHGSSLVSMGTPDESKVSSAWNAIIPIAVLMIGVFISGGDILAGAFLALFAQFVLYIPQKLLSLSEFFACFFDGARSMTGLCIICTFSFLFSATNEKLGLFELMIGGLSAAVPAVLLPTFVFIVVGFTTFATAGCWTIQVLALPIFMPLAAALGVSPLLVIAALMSGVNMGYTCCFYADAVFMVAAGTELSNLRIIKTTLPYAFMAIAVTIGGYILLGAVF